MNYRHQNRGKVRGCDLGKAELERCYDMLEPLWCYEAVVWYVGGEDLVSEIVRRRKQENEDVRNMFRILHELFPDESKKTRGAYFLDVVKILIRELSKRCCGNCKFLVGTSGWEGCSKLDIDVPDESFYCKFWEKPNV